MKVTYTGPEDFSSKQRDKLEAKLRKIGKFVDGKGEKEAHIILSHQRFLHKAEITVNSHDHALVSVGSDADQFTAICTAIEKLEKQVVKMRAKWRDTHRHKTDKSAAPAPAPVAPPTGKKSKAALAASNAKKPSRVFKVNHQDGRKPMTLEEAMLEMGNSQDYMVYRDAVTNKVSVLMRRGDGHLDLVES
jgi:putative sigma-54 modulation protein